MKLRKSLLPSTTSQFPNISVYLSACPRVWCQITPLDPQSQLRPSLIHFPGHQIVCLKLDYSSTIEDLKV
ncbi:hypothetical protein AQUCO_01000369v1 [Aquilegia coerulea]|uniref:Uncharacterized protein n=1 Tax=Aquilegia coerulea TaxID=218851 RepID=A0A2G5E9K6_AQUCA|nr:hypothetical protein AQUCO_01000369v1 [Aquilegia coerulea]